VARIRAHFDSVLSELPARDLSSRTAAQRARRAGLLATLRAYRDRGDFPHNYDFPGQLVPYFVDRKTGTLCAVAHLLESTGRRDIVDRVARMNNNVWVSALAGDTALTHWLDDNGLTIAEAARIQVPYAAPAATMPTVVGASLVVGTSLVSSLVNGLTNRDGHGTTRSVVGIVAGVASVGLGTAFFGPLEAPNVGVVATTTGGLSLLIASRGVFRHHRIMVAKRDAERRKREVTPIVTPGTASTGPAIGLNVRF
jgi:hypothetical protein